MRQKITNPSATKDMVVMMAEGNPGAAVVMMQLLENPMGTMSILDMDDMNIRGEQIWIGYKDFCKQDIEAFRKALKDRNPSMVALINQSSGTKEKAVVGGAS